METRRLGGSDVEVTPIGQGCMQFSGDRGVAARFYAPMTQEAVTAVVRAALDGGVTWFDTAEMYGGGHSEHALAVALQECGVRPGEVAVATKWSPLGRSTRHLRRTIDVRLGHLAGYPIDLYQIHMPHGGLATTRGQLRTMAGLLRAGKIRAVGVSNFSARGMRIAHEALAAEGIALASNQVQISLIKRSIEANGVLAAARELGVTLIAYSPLGGGVLSGRYHASPDDIAALPRVRRLFNRRRVGARDLARTAPLIDELGAVARAHGATRAQVALAWLIRFYGDTVVAIPGASRPGQAREAAAAMDLDLSPAQLAGLDAASRRAGTGR